MRSAFTLVELLAVLAIIGLLAAAVFGGWPLMQSRADSARCLSNLRSLGIGLNAYLAENNMTMPPLAAARSSINEDVPVIDTVLAPFVDDKRAFTCPADHELAQMTGTSYFWNSALSGQQAASLNLFAIVTDQSKIPVLVDKEGWHRFSENRVNHLFADGHAAKELRLFTSP